MLNFKKIREKGVSFKLFWDIFVFSLVLPNLFLILFDFTYLILRPTYLKYYPKIVSLYDPILGIEKHRTTEDYTRSILELENLHKLSDSENIGKILKLELNQLLEFIQQKKEYTENKTIIETIASIQKLEVTTSNKIVIETLNGFILNLQNNIKDLSDITEYSEISKKFDIVLQLIGISNSEGLKNEYEKVLGKMDLQMLTIIEDNPFRDSGQAHVFKNIQKIIKDYFNSNASPKQEDEYKNLLSNQLNTKKKIPSTVIAFSYFWRNEKVDFFEKIKFFNENLLYQFDLNYFRTTDLSGSHTNNFYILDAPFFIFFLIEFFVRWYLSIIKKKYLAWFLYPVYHWYDVLGLIPLQTFHFFRLFRLYRIYQILKESEFTTIGDDIISRTIRYYSNIMKEEISDMVTIQILSETQEEIRSGSSIEVLTNAVNKHRQDIKEVVFNRLSNPPATERIENLIQKLIINTMNTPTAKFFDIPFVQNKEKILIDSFQFIMNEMKMASRELMKSESGREIVGNIVDLVLDEIVEVARSEDLNRLNQEITIDLLENVKKQVEVKKWVNTKI